MTRAVVAPRGALALALLVVLALTAGCTALTGDEGELPAAETVENRTDAIDAIEATVVSTIDTDTVSNTSKIRMVTRPDTGHLRAEVLGPGGANGTLIVSNGTTMSMYDRGANRVQVIDVGNLTAASGTNSMDSVVDIFAALDEAADDERTSVNVSPLPVVPTGSAGGSAVGTQSLSIYGNVSLSYEGTDTVDGRDAYVVEMVPRADDSIVEENTYWFDQEWYYPIKSVGHTNLSALNGTISMEYRNVTFNPDVSNETFEFDAPENATVVDSPTSNFTADTYDSREALASVAERPLPEPDIPDDYRFDTGTHRTNGSTASVTLRYTNGTASLSVSSPPGGGGNGSSLGESIEVDGREATITTIRDTHSLTLDCGERTYTVTGSQARETIVEVAASIDC